MGKYTYAQCHANGENDTPCEHLKQHVHPELDVDGVRANSLALGYPIIMMLMCFGLSKQQWCDSKNLQRYPNVQ